MKKKIQRITSMFAATAALLLSTSVAHAYVLDTKIGEAKLSNATDAAELNAIKSITGLDLVLDDKVYVNTALQNPGTMNQWYLDVAPTTPGYFALKFNISGTAATANTFFFQNIGELTKLVWENAQVQGLSGDDKFCTIERIDHYTTFSGGTQVPEPGSLALLSLGLFGFAGVRKARGK